MTTSTRTAPTTPAAPTAPSGDDAVRTPGGADEPVLPTAGPDAAVDALVEEAVALAGRWRTAGTSSPGTRTPGTSTPGTGDPAPTAAAGAPAASRSARAADARARRRERTATQRLASLVHDPAGVEFALGFVDKVARPEDDATAARELRNLARGELPDFLGPVDRALVAAGGVAAPLLPGVVVPAAKVRLRQLVGHLVVDARDSVLTPHLARARAAGERLNLNLLGEAVLGDAEADRRLERTAALVAREDVDYVSVKASSVAAQLHPWDLEGSRDRLVARLLPLYTSAAAGPRPTFLNLDMEEYKDLHLTVEVFTALLARPELHDLEAGIVLQAYLPDALGALERITAAAQDRVARGGARVKVRLVKGANLAMEAVDAELHDWPQAPYTTKADVDANCVRLLDVALDPARTAAVRIGVASHNLFDVALAHLLAERRGVGEALDVEMLQGMAPAQARAVAAQVGSLVLYTPVVHRDDFDVAVSYLVRRLEENAASQNFLFALFSGDPAAATPGAEMAGQERAFRTSVTRRWEVPAAPRRTQDRTAVAARHTPGTPFHNTPDTDPSLPANRRWARAVLAGGAPASAAAPPVVTEVAAVEAAVATARAAGTAWAGAPAATRAAALHAVGDALEAHRGDLVAVMAAEAGKTVPEGDPEVSEAVDFARYYADRALELDGDPRLAGVAFTPHRVVLVTPPWNFPVAIPLGSVLAALAAGSAVIIKPAPQAVRCAAVAVAAVHGALDAAGVPRDVLQLVNADEADAGRALVSHEDVDAVVLTGSTETARLFASWRPGLRLLAETSGKNALVVTPGADLDLAVADAVRSAFGHAGQKCSAASLVIAVGSVGTSERFLRQLEDAVRSLRVGWPTDIATNVGPLVEPASDKLRRALTTLEPGERWLVEPRPLDTHDPVTAVLWSPGLRTGVAPGSWFHTTEVFGPVLGVMTAPTLDAAIELQNAVGYGLTGGIHSLDDAEVEHWLEQVEVGGAYVNRHTTGAVVQRQPFGGWKDSVRGPGAKAGGPHYVAQLGSWADDGAAPHGAGATPQADAAAVLSAAAPLLDAPAAARLRAAAGSDQAAWEEEFAREQDPTGLAVESNVLRYRSLPHLAVRCGAGARVADLARVALVAARAGVPLVVSTAPGGEALAAFARSTGSRVVVEDDAAAARGVAAATPGDRLRLLGASAGLHEAAARAGVSVLDAAPVVAGRRELLTVLREQAVSRTRHRFGHVHTSRP